MSGWHEEIGCCGWRTRSGWLSKDKTLIASAWHCGAAEVRLSGCDEGGEGRIVPYEALLFLALLQQGKQVVCGRLVRTWKRVRSSKIC